MCSAIKQQLRCHFDAQQITNILARAILLMLFSTPFKVDATRQNRSARQIAFACKTQSTLDRFMHVLKNHLIGKTVAEIQCVPVQCASVMNFNSNFLSMEKIIQFVGVK